MASKNESCVLINNLSVQIEVEKLNRVINSQVDQIFKNRGPIVINVLNDQELLFTPLSNVKLSFEGDKIYGTLPVHINTKLNAPVKVVKVEADINVEFESTIEFNNTQNVKVTTNIKQIEWMTGPDISPPLVDFIIPDSMVREMVEKSLPNINEKINENLAEALNIETLLSKTVWHKILEIPLNEEDSMYLSVKPETIEIYRINMDAKMMKLSINTRLILKPIESAERPDTKYVPKVTFLHDYSVGTSLGIEVRLDLESLEKPALKVVKSIAGIEKAIHCTIEKILVRQVGEEGVAIALRLKGALNGGLSIAGNPQVNQKTLMLDIENLSFNFSGKNIFSSLKGNIALSVAKSFIRKQFPIALRPYIENLIATLNDMISNLKLANGLFLRGDIQHWDLVRMDIVNGQAILVVNSNLTLELAPGIENPVVS